MRILVLLLLTCMLPYVFSLSAYINENQNIIIDDSRVQINSNGNVSIHNITSEIFDIKIQNNDLFQINLAIEKINNTLFTYNINTTIPLASYNSFRNSGDSFLEYTTNFDIQTNRDISLIKFNRDSNATLSSRDISIQIRNPTNYTQKLHINLIKTRPNQVNEFRNQLYLLTMYELELEPNQYQEIKYKDVLSEVGDSYFVDYSIKTIPKINRDIFRTEVYNSTSSRSSGSGKFNLITQDLIITKSILPEVFSLNDIITVTLKISNPNSFSLTNVEIEEVIPNGFIFIENQNLGVYSIIEGFLPFENKEVTYKLKYIGSNTTSIQIPGTKIKYNEKIYYSNPVQVYPQEIEKPTQLLIEKVLTPLDNFKTLIQIYITNIGNTSISSFTLEDQNQSFYVPKLDSLEQFIIEYESETADYSLPKITTKSNVTTSIIINDKISITHETKSKLSTYSIALIILAGILLISDIVL